MRPEKKPEPASDSALTIATDALLAAIRAEPVPPRITELALRLQSTLDARREALAHTGAGGFPRDTV